MNGTNYPSDLTDEQWQIISKLLPPRKKRGRPPVDRREIVNAILYVNRTGCQWRALPHDFPKWKTVYTVFWRWRKDGLWQKINDALRERVRVAARKETYAYGGDHRQPIGEDHRGRRRRTWLRCRQKDRRPETTYRGRHLGIGVGGRGAWGLLAGSNRSRHRVVASAGQIPPVEGDLRRLGLWSRRLGRDRQGDVWLDTANGASPCRSQRLCRLAKAMDCRTDLRLAISLSSSQQRLRTQSRNQRGNDPHHDDKPHVPPPCNCKILI